MWRYNWIFAPILLMIGFILLWAAATIFNQNSQYYILLSNLGSAFIVTAIAMLILNKAVGGIEHKFLDEIKELTDRLGILPKVKECQIENIFERRRKNPDFKKELIRQFDNTKDGEEILLMSNSLRDFFITRQDRDDYLNAIFEMLKRGIKLKILLLDPTSQAARDRALVEERKRVESKGYINSTLFTEIKKVAEWLHNPPQDLDLDEDIREKIENKIEVRFFPYDPTTQLIITDKFTFIEQYHRGGGKEIRKELKKEKISQIDCFGGFVPVLMVDNSASYAKLMKSHFKNIWNSKDVRKRNLRENFYQKILEFETKERERLQK
jgi:hypothetical protein